MLTFQDVLQKAGIAAEDVNVMLHSPYEPTLQRVFPALVRTNRAAMEAYQAVHGIGPERALRQGRPWVASFAKIAQDTPTSHSQMLFVGLYRNDGSRLLSHADIMDDVHVRFMRDAFGAFQHFDAEDDRTLHRWFDLVLSDRIADLQGRLVISVKLTPNYVRKAENLDAPIRGIQLESAFDAAPPDWRSWVLSTGELRAILPGWVARLREWRGIYLIRDRSDGARYVGSACGADNLLGRWQAHVFGERGVTVELARRSPANFEVSILERVSPDMEVSDITAREQGWMTRLHTKVDGLNR